MTSGVLRQYHDNQGRFCFAITGEHAPEGPMDVEYRLEFLNAEAAIRFFEVVIEDIRKVQRVV